MDNKHCIETLLPHQIDAALAEKSIVYVPLGAIEWHGLHLPIGLDGFTSHGVCCKVAAQMGGLVFPPLFYGMTGSIGHHPWTILIENENTLLEIIRTTLTRIETFGVKCAVIFTGHFGRKQLALLQKLRTTWEEENHSLTLLVTSISECPDAGMEPDHAGIFETSLLSQLRPELVQLNKLPPKETHPANDPNGDSKGPHRRDPENILFGILGDDPRYMNESDAKELLSTIVHWLKTKVGATYNAVEGNE